MIPLRKLQPSTPRTKALMERIWTKVVKVVRVLPVIICPPMMTAHTKNTSTRLGKMPRNTWISTRLRRAKGNKQSRSLSGLCSSYLNSKTTIDQMQVMLMEVLRWPIKKWFKNSEVRSNRFWDKLARSYWKETSIWQQCLFQSKPWTITASSTRSRPWARLARTSTRWPR